MFNLLTIHFQEKSTEERSDAGSQAEASDYDVDEEYDNDYAENYFDNGEGDDLDNLDGGAAEEGGGGGGKPNIYTLGLRYILTFT